MKNPQFKSPKSELPKGELPPSLCKRYPIQKVTALCLIIAALVLTTGTNLNSANPGLSPAPFKADAGDTISVFVSDSTFAFGATLLNSWLPPQSSIIVNDGSAPENFLGRISQFSTGSVHWAISDSVNGPDSIRAQWSTASASGSWNDISGFNSDFIIATGVQVDDTITIWFRIETPTSTSSFDQFLSTMTVTASQN